MTREELINERNAAVGLANHFRWVIANCEPLDDSGTCRKCSSKTVPPEACAHKSDCVWYLTMTSDPLAAPRLANVEAMAEQLHDWYLNATEYLNPAAYNPAAQKSYAELTDDQRSIDRYIAAKVIDLLCAGGEEETEVPPAAVDDAPVECDEKTARMPTEEAEAPATTLSPRMM